MDSLERITGQVDDKPGEVAQPGDTLPEVEAEYVIDLTSKSKSTLRLINIDI